MRFLILAPIALLPAAIGSCPGSSDDGPGSSGLFDRPADGIVLTGDALPGLLGLAPGAIAAFRWTDVAGWAQVPVQVDERAVVPWLQVYAGLQPPWPVGLGPDDQVLAWCDPATYTGPDPDPALDADDEVALAALDAGERAPAAAALPAGALAEGLTELRLFDPLNGAVGWLYLVQHDGGLSPAAGQDRVHYSFQLASGLSYLDGYQVIGGPNPELSSFESPGVWSTAFSDRWVRQNLRVFAGSATGVDLLDRQRTSSDPPDCLRNEDTFCGYGSDPSEGVFLANIDGAVRAIRSVAGANSGVLMQRDHVFWPQREDETTFVRVHPINYPMEDVLNLDTSALGMRFSAPWTGPGVVLDGDPTGDPIPPVSGLPTWEMVTGDLGTIVSSHKVIVDDPDAQIVSAFRDDLDPQPPPCTGDPYALGAFGWRLRNQLGNTDPRLAYFYGVLYTARIERAYFFEAPNQQVALAQLRYAQHLSPVEVDAALVGPAAPVLLPPPPPAPLALDATAAGDVIAALHLPGGGAVTWSLASGSLPQGLALDPAGVLRGRTRDAGAHHLALRADSAAGSTLVEVDLTVPQGAAVPFVPAWMARLPFIGGWVVRTAVRWSERAER